MNTRNPLAAALLLIASAASAQTYAPGAGFNFGGTNSAPFSLSGTNAASALDDATFTCSSPYLVHIPFAACTTQQLRDRESFNGVCPPKSQACRDYLARAMSGTNPAGTIAAYNPPDGTQWASPDCTHIPCKLADNNKSGEKKESSEVNDNIQGPPQMLDMPKGGPEGKMLQYPSGRIVYCFDNSCTKTSGEPMTPSEAKKYLKEQYADQKQMANSINGGNNLTETGNKFTGLGLDDGPGGGDKTTAGGPSAGGAGKGGSGGPGLASNDGGGGSSDSGSNGSASDEAKGFGRQAASDSAAVSGRSGSGSGSGASVASNGYSASETGRDQVIKTRAAELDGVYTYNKTRVIKDSIERTAGAVTGDSNGTFATPTNTPDANAGDLKFKGTQSGANQ